jgi:hypothetical protein
MEMANMSAWPHICSKHVTCESEERFIKSVRERNARRKSRPTQPFHGFRNKFSATMRLTHLYRRNNWIANEYADSERETGKMKLRID